MPARRNACTKRRWNSTKPISRGAITMTADITAMSTPFSGAAKIDRPTVRGRVVSDRVGGDDEAFGQHFDRHAAVAPGKAQDFVTPFGHARRTSRHAFIEQLCLSP